MYSLPSLRPAARFSLAAIFVAVLTTTAPSPVLADATPLTDAQISQVRANLIESSDKSWELGTAAQTLLELDWPELSVFSDKSLPPPSRLTGKNNASDVLAIAGHTVDTRPANYKPLMRDGAVGDPASIGVAVILTDVTRSDPSVNKYQTAAEEQLDFLLHDAPKGPDGTISHRVEYAQYWSDFVYMAPPFIAYFGAVRETGDAQVWLLREAYNQAALYRKNLRNPSVNLWHHIMSGPWQDRQFWATGHGWAGAGMLRVLYTIRHSESSHLLVKEQEDLTRWVEEIIKGVWEHQQRDGGLLNDLPNPESFPDRSAVALMAAVTYRWSTLTNSTEYIENADRAYSLVSRSIDEDGWLHPVVNPYDFFRPGERSPEGQAFALLAHTAWRDYRDALENTRDTPAAGVLDLLHNVFGGDRPTE